MLIHFITLVYSLPSPKTRGKIRRVLNSCWIHAEFIFTLNFHNALRNTLHNNGVEFMLNSCWIHAEFKQVREKYMSFYNFSSFLRNPRLYS